MHEVEWRGGQGRGKAGQGRAWRRAGIFFNITCTEWSGEEGSAGRAGNFFIYHVQEWSGE